MMLAIIYNLKPFSSKDCVIISHSLFFLHVPDVPVHMCSHLNLTTFDNVLKCEVDVVHAGCRGGWCLKS